MICKTLSIKTRDDNRKSPPVTADTVTLEDMANYFIALCNPEVSLEAFLIQSKA